MLFLIYFVRWRMPNWLRLSHGLNGGLDLSKESFLMGMNEGWLSQGLHEQTLPDWGTTLFINAPNLHSSVTVPRILCLWKLRSCELASVHSDFPAKPAFRKQHGSGGLTLHRSMKLGNVITADFQARKNCFTSWSRSPPLRLSGGF